MDPEKLIDNENGMKEAKEEEEEEIVFDTLTKTHELAYAVGHFLNDLTATGWINYMLIYLTSINPISPTQAAANAGAVMLGGQIADGFTTPLVGYFSDKTKTRFGKRKPWYVAGTIIVIVCYVFIFENCLFSYAFPDTNQDMLKVFYYTLFGSLFNIGWAFVQVAHMSLVPSLTSSRIKRDRLNSYRNSFTYLANFLVLGLSLIYFTLISSPLTQFRILSYSIIFFGAMTSLFFIVKIDEVNLMSSCLRSSSAIRSLINEKKKSVQSSMDHLDHVNGDEINENLNPEVNQNVDEVEVAYEWYEWFKLKAFYQYGAAYIGVRITSNCLGALINFYLVFVLKISNGDLTQSTPFQLALIPLLLYFFSVMASLCLERMYRRIGRKLTYVIGGFFVCLSSVVMMFLTSSTAYLMYIFTCTFGIGQSLCLNTGIAFLSEVVGRKGGSGAFVFGFFSFWDKVLNGIILFLILNSTYMEKNEDATEFVRYVTCLIPMAGCIVAGVLIVSGQVKDYKWNKSGKMSVEDEFAED